MTLNELKEQMKQYDWLDLELLEDLKAYYSNELESIRAIISSKFNPKQYYVWGMTISQISELLAEHDEFIKNGYY